MPGTTIDPVAALLETEVRLGSFPGAVWIVEERGRVLSGGAVGHRAVLPEAQSARPDTIYDLASLTKPLITAALLVLLEQDGIVPLDAPAVSLLPGLACDRDGRPTLLDLAVHRSGLPSWRPFWAFAKNTEGVLNSVMDLDLERPCGTRVVYSDPGYILLGEALRRATGKSLDRLFRERIADPLGLEGAGFCPPASQRPRIAPTEMGNRYERELAAPWLDAESSTGAPARPRAPQARSFAGAPAEETPAGADPADPEPAESRRRAEVRTDARRPRPGCVRDYLIHGEVHDGNAWALGGVSGHAGLFAPAADVAALAREFLGSGSGLFGRRALDLFRENLTPGLEEGRTVGWRRATPGAREAEGVLPEGSFGHTGFTGTSLWLDPIAGRSYVLLTNRVHPEVKPIDMNLRRRRFHEIAKALA